MTAVPARPTGSVPRHALRRGTRGFAALVLFLSAAVVLAIAGFVLPSSDLGRLALSWLIPLAIAFGIAHVVAVFGLLVWLIGSWLVAARFAVRGMAAPERRAVDAVAASVATNMVEAQHHHHVLHLSAAVR
jgi:hypothetical protein